MVNFGKPDRESNPNGLPHHSSSKMTLWYSNMACWKIPCLLPLVYFHEFPMYADLARRFPSCPCLMTLDGNHHFWWLLWMIIPFYPWNDPIVSHCFVSWTSWTFQFSNRVIPCDSWHGIISHAMCCWLKSIIIHVLSISICVDDVLLMWVKQS